MTAKDIGTRDLTAAVRVRAGGDVDEASLAYVRQKVVAALDRPGLPPADGEVRVVRGVAHHVEQPWSASAEIRIGSHLVVVHAREADARQLADRLHDRLRGRTARLMHPGDGRTLTPPPWRGGPQQ